MYQTSLPKTLPTMYDLPSENQKEPGLPDEFHLLQPELLRLTFRPPNYANEQIFTGSDLNLYYDPAHTQWYKRPDWFGVLGVSRLYQDQELRLSYVIWQEKVSPFVAVELISPGTEPEDLGKTLREVDQPPTKWQVYEQILQIPYYFVFNRYTDELQAFHLVDNFYQTLIIEDKGIWLPEARLGLGLWRGSYQGINRLWLRWYDQQQNWVLTPAELGERRAEQEEHRAEQEKHRAERAEAFLQQERVVNQRLAQRLRELGVDPDTL